MKRSLFYSPRVVNARAELIAVLGHWKDGTRPGDDRITEADVSREITNLIFAAIEGALLEFATRMDAMEAESGARSDDTSSAGGSEAPEGER